MLGQIRSCALVGIDAIPIDVEVLARSGEKESNFQVVGLVDSAIREARGRVISALQRSACTVPNVIFVNLAPAEIKKEGAGFDLPIAIGIVTASKQLRPANPRETFFFGELSLDGSVKAVRGVVALAISAYESGAKVVVVPEKNVSEARLVKGLTIIGVRTLNEALRAAEGEFNGCPGVDQIGGSANSGSANSGSADTGSADTDSGNTVSANTYNAETAQAHYLSQVRGQNTAKRAMVIGAAGGHNLIFIGPPGCGKSMLAQRFGNLLPPLTDEERFETVKIHSIVGLPIRTLLDGTPPFRSPHHVVSDVGLIGGGVSPRPGEISLAHNGVLFLDEFPEYRRSALESLRTPLETGTVRISRAKGSILLPARFQLLAAMNPCPCGRLGSKQQRCLCSESMLQMYLRRLSQPILERIDLQVELEEIHLSELTDRSRSDDVGVDDREFQSTVSAAREMQHTRQGHLNCRLEGNVLLKGDMISSSAMRLLEHTAKKNLISARSFVRVLRMARTIADLARSSQIEDPHIAEAMSYRVLDRRRPKSDLSQVA